MQATKFGSGTKISVSPVRNPDNQGLHRFLEILEKFWDFENLIPGPGKVWNLELGLEKFWTSGNPLLNGARCTVHVQPCRLAMGVLGFVLPSEVSPGLGVGLGKVLEFG